METRRLATFARLTLAAIVLSSSAAAHAQSPYGLAARQTIPFVIDLQDVAGGPALWLTELDFHNPGSLPVTVQPVYLPINVKIGPVSCNPVTIGPGATLETTLHLLCNTPSGLSFGSLQVSSLNSVNSGEATDPGGRIFLATARIARLGAFFTVEGFPQGQLSGNQRSAAVNGLKSGSVGPNNWRTGCYATTVGEAVPVYVRLVDGNGQQIGNFASAAIDPNLGIEGATFTDVFTAVGAPPGNYTDVTALFSTAPLGGIGGGGVFGFCRIQNTTTFGEAFAIAKYLDNNDDAKQYVVSADKSRVGETFAVVNEIILNDQSGRSNMHVAYFEHPDKVSCSIRFTSHPEELAVFDLGQMRLIDPDDNVAAGGAHKMDFSLDLREKSVHNNGRNGRWIIEVAPDRGFKETGGLHKGSLGFSEYVLTCSSGQGMNQLDMIGRCPVDCAKDKGNEVVCSFKTPFPVNQCYQ
jgi:hypothetical protein